MGCRRQTRRGSGARMTPSIVVMGVSGSGKSTIGAELAARLGCRFVDADDLHPPQNVAHMQSGQALNDDMRRPWLDICGQTIAAEKTVLACSALKRSYRDILRSHAPDMVLVYLDGSQEDIHARMAQRAGHFMPLTLLQSQFDTLEQPAAPEPHIAVSILSSTTGIVDDICIGLSG